MAYTIGALVVSAASTADSSRRQRNTANDAANAAKIEAAGTIQANQLAADDAAKKQALATDTAQAQKLATEQMSKAPTVQLSTEANVRRRAARAEFNLDAAAGASAPLRV